VSAKGNGAASITADHYPTPPSLVTRLAEVIHRGPRDDGGAMLRAPTAFRERTFLDIGAGEGAISR
jgi:hypothetical protein